MIDNIATAGVEHAQHPIISSNNEIGMTLDAIFNDLFQFERRFAGLPPQALAAGERPAEPTKPPEAFIPRIEDQQRRIMQVIQQIIPIVQRLNGTI